MSSRRILVALLFLAAAGSANCCKCGCAVGGGDWCLMCNVCEVQDAANNLQRNWNAATAALAKTGQVFDQAKATVSDPSGFIRDTIIDGAKKYIGDQLERQLGIHNICNNADKEAFGSNGWRPYYGKRLWETRGYGLLVASIVPATSAVAVQELMGELKSQFGVMINMLEQAARDSGSELQELMMRMFNDIVSAAASGRVVAPVINTESFGIKAAVIHVPCSNTAAGFKLPSEGYYQFAFAYYINTPEMRRFGEVPRLPRPMGPAYGGPIVLPGLRGPLETPSEVCKHDCNRCGQNGPCFFGRCTGGCKRCCWMP